MDDALNLSLTKGILVHKPDGKKKKNVKLKDAYPSHQNCRDLYNTMEEQIQEIEESVYEETFSSLVNFVKTYHSSVSVKVQEIPSAILVMGVNMPDHSNIFRLLGLSLNKSGIPATVVLQSHDCSSFFSLMQKLVPGVINKLNQAKGECVTLKRIDYSFSHLLSYYENWPRDKFNAPSKSPRKKKNTEVSQSKPILILIQDVEAFKPEVLQELIMNCSLYVGVLPIVLVFGMATAMVTLHDILTQKALSCLGIETFYSLTAIEYLTKIIQKVVLNPENPFKLGPKVFRLIIDTVLYHDFSVMNLKHMLKLCMLEHFFHDDLTYLCCDVRVSKSHINVFTSDQLQMFKKLPSISRFLENNPDYKVNLKNKGYFQDLLLKFLERHHTYYAFMNVLLNCLHICTKDLPGHPMGKHLRELYPMVFDCGITDLPAYSHSVKLLKMLSKEELVMKLKTCLEVVDVSIEPKFGEMITEIRDVLQNLIVDIGNIKEVECETESFVCKIIDDTKITSRSQLQEKIKLQIKSKRSQYEKCRENVVDSLTTIFKKLIPPSSIPLYEVIYFDNVAAMKQHLMPSPRITLHRNLVNPKVYLKCSCCSIEGNGDMVTSMPDISILYKLHLECGKLINLCDWLEAFKAVKENNAPQKLNAKKKIDFDTELNIRFMHAVTELQLLGFVKPTKRKTDHVARLTFGTSIL